MEPEEEMFWRYVAREDMHLQRCRSCERWLAPPGPVCPDCLSRSLEWSAISGDGTVWSYTVYRHSFADHLDARVPYALVLVETAEGPLLMGNLIGADFGPALIGMPVRVEYGAADDLPSYRFVPAARDH
ncbi:MAG: OB-fold domain-containing protein [Acidobacteriota bacterium]|nr:OB-fold domain-containing protein [Acidobacteriota bacterium]